MSEWKQGAAKRRDARNTKTPNEVPKPTAARKDTKRWCGGKVGREHTMVCAKYRDVKAIGGGLSEDYAKRWRIRMCTTCGKELETYYGGKRKPEWVK